MKRALGLAKKGAPFAFPNPLVGAVLVKNGKIVSEGFHARFGGDHAEIAAIKKAGAAARGCTLYVNLEPCAHFNKKTPPCAPHIIKAGIKRVVIATKDPNPLVNGRGINKLEDAGIKVDVGILRVEAEKLNEKFVFSMKNKRPYVAMKVAMTLDGKIAASTGDSKWITCEKSRGYVKTLRDNYDAVLVGINTVLKDNPVLSGAAREPKRIILDSSLKIPVFANVLRDGNIMLITTDKAPKKKINFLNKMGAEVKVFKDKIDIDPLLRWLHVKGISSVFVEGGSGVFGSFVDSKKINKIYCFIAPKILGGKDSIPAVSVRGAKFMKNALQLKFENIQKIGSDVLIEAVF